MKRSNIHSKVWIVIWIIVSSFHIRKQKISHISINYLYLLHCTIPLRLTCSCRCYLHQLFLLFKILCDRVFCNTFIHGDAPQFEKKVSTFEQSECIIWIFSTTSSVKDNVLWMKCNFNVAFKKWVCFKILLRNLVIT